VAPSIQDEGLGPARAYEPGREASGTSDIRAKDGDGPDPVVGAGITLLGIFLMGTGGARDAHYVFDVGVGTAVLGAVTFVVSVALSALKQHRARTKSDPPTLP
jgi:hypothetical protein